MKTLWRLCAVAVCLVGGVGIAVWLFSVIVHGQFCSLWSAFRVIPDRVKPAASPVMPAIHLMGGTIMGTGADNSVVNSFGQTHEVPNLYVAGPGIFPTCGASNPTYTIFALSLRAAENLASNWSAIAG